MYNIFYKWASEQIPRMTRSLHNHEVMEYSMDTIKLTVTMCLFLSFLCNENFPKNRRYFNYVKIVHVYITPIIVVYIIHRSSGISKDSTYPIIYDL